MSKIEEMIKRLCPKGVERAFLTNIASILYGYPFEASLFTENDKYIPLIRIRDILSGTPSTFYIGDYSDEYIIKEGDMLVGMDGNFNLRKWKSRNGLLCQRTCKIESKDESVVLNNYLYQILVPLFKRIEDNTPSGSVKHLSARTINNISIPLPPLCIQREIISVLDSFTTLIDKMKQEVVLRKKRMEYYREKLLSFDEQEADFVKIKDLFDTKNGYTPSTKNPDFWTDKGIPWVKMEDIRENGTVLSDSAKHITMSAVKGSKLFNANSIILATSATIGVHALVTVPHLSNQRFTNIYPKKEYENKIDMKYAYYYFFKIDRWCKEHVTLGNFAGVNMSDFYEYDFPLPPLSTQRSIVSTLDAFEQYISKLERLITLREKQYAYYREKLLTFE